MAEPQSGEKRRVVFHFGGTGERQNRNSYDACDEYTQYDEGVIRIYIHGCQNPNVGNSYLNPDLDRVVQRIKRSFSGQGETATLNLETLKNELKSGLSCITVGTKGAAPDELGFASHLMETNESASLKKLDLKQRLPLIEVEKIALTGFSRGAVTTFAVAQGLDELNVPMYIVADQPVPGETGNKRPILTKYQDCSQLNNLEKAVTMLAEHDKTEGLFQETYFQQMVPLGLGQDNHQAYFLPTQRHVQPNQLRFRGEHVGLHMSEFGFVAEKKATQLEKYIEQEYETCNYAFTPRFLQQPVYGLDHNEEIDRDPCFKKMIREKAENYIESNRYEQGLFPRREDHENPVDQFIETIQSFERQKQYLLYIFYDLTHSDLEDLDSFNLCKGYFKNLYLENTYNEEQKEMISNAVIGTYELARYYEAKIIRNNLPNEKNEALRLGTHVQTQTRRYILDVLTAHQKYIDASPPGSPPDEQAQKNFCLAVTEAGKNYSQSILSEKGFIRTSRLRATLDILLHLMVVGMMVNFVKKLITGKWLLSRVKTNPENLAKKTIQNFKNALKQFDRGTTRSKHEEKKEEKDEGSLRSPSPTG